MRYYSSKEVCEILHISRRTLQRWSNSGKIKYIRTVGGWRRYDLDGYLNINEKLNVKIIYCRVSSYDRKLDIDKQVRYLKKLYPTYEVITDIGSGINFKRKGLRKIIKLAFDGILEEIVVTYKDRLYRIGYDLLEYIMKTYSNTKIIISKCEDKLPIQKIIEDLIEIITVYSSKIHGSRSNEI